MKKAFLLIFLFAFSLMPKAYSAPGDTTIVQVHNATDMTWYGAYDAWGVFPAAGTTYEQVIMVYTMGCASTGCSDWDYTTSILLRDYLGIMDSTVASVDSITGDTTWNVFELVDNYELGKVITPYGGYMANGSNGYNNNWKHEHYFDVTDYQNMLRDSVHIRAFYSGWSSGFSATVDFIFIEGTPPRDVISADLLWGNFRYTTPADVNQNRLKEHEIVFPAHAKGAQVVTSISGHGMDDIGNCGEFCNKYYQILVDSAVVYQKNIWRGNCGMNPIYPQGGTWVYNRANWCPGSRVRKNFIELTPHITPGDTHLINMNMQAYNWSGGQPSYSNNGVLFMYDSINHQLDAALTDIITPTNKKDYKRFNPNCDLFRVEVTNKGADAITSLSLEYKVVGGPTWTYNWSGNLEFMESEVIEMPIPDPTVIMNASVKKVEVDIVSVNGGGDDVAHNDHYESDYRTLHERDWNTVIEIKTNSRAFENSWTLTDADGNIVESRFGMSNNTVYRDTLALLDGCYAFRLDDSGDDGLSWWASGQGVGYIRFRNVSGAVVKSFNADFGSALLYQFIVMGSGLSMDSYDASEVRIYPNPNDGRFRVEWTEEMNVQSISVIDISGREVYRQSLTGISSELDLSFLSSGLYHVVLSGEKGDVIKKLQITN
jgi:hypothetical protein